MLVLIEQAKLSKVGGTDPDKIFNHEISQSNTSITLRTKAFDGISEGDYVNITGVVGFFNNPQGQTNLEDVIKVDAPSIEMVMADPDDGGSLPIDGIVTLTTPTEGANIIYKLNGGEEKTIEDKSGKVVITSFDEQEHTATITAKAVKGSDVSEESVFNYKQAKAGLVKVSVEGKITDDTKVSLSADKDAVIYYTIKTKVGSNDESISQEDIYKEPIDVKVSDLPVEINAYSKQEKYLDSDKSVFKYYEGSNGTYKNYFGQLHSHTAENSDGYGTLDEAYDHAKNVAGLDFFAVTDHSNSFDEANPNDKAGTYNLGAYNKDNIQWQNGQNAAAKALSPDFVSIYGYEMTWSGGPGHMNTFNTEGFVSRNNKELNNKSNDAGLRAYYELLKNTPNVIAMFNHPGKTFGTFSEFSYLDPVIDQRISLLEVGNGEGKVGSGAYFPSYSEYTKALDKGWHLAPTNNQDNHKGNWGDSNTARTVIYTDDFSVNGLYDSLRDMRVYATEDNNLDIVYKVNDRVLGSIFEIVPEEANFNISVKDPDSEDKISKISIITNNGQVAWSQTYSSNEAVFEKTVSNPSSGYYYVKVVQADGDIAVTAPVWLGSTPKVGISSFEYDALVPSTNECLNFEAKLFNNESSDAVIKSITYSLKDEGELQKLESFDLNETMDKSGGMYTHKFSHTFTKAGKKTLVLTALISQEGKELTYSKELEINVTDSDKLISVGIDASHFNEYVSGNYKISMTNFAKLAAKYNVKAVELKTSQDLIDAMKNPNFAIMIFTAPSRRAGSSGRVDFRSYSDEELKALSDFSKEGKTVIVTGWGDYYESYSNLKELPSFTPDQHMAAQQNKLLKAIGSSLRLTDDEIKDPVSNGGQPQRLRLREYNNFVDPLTQGVVQEQEYSQYGGSSVYAVDKDGIALDKLPSNIYPTVSGFTTTISSDDDKDGNPQPPKYDDKLLVMAHEEVQNPNGTNSSVIVAGGAFMSNFEI